MGHLCAKFREDRFKTYPKNTSFPNNFGLKTVICVPFDLLTPLYIHVISLSGCCWPNRSWNPVQKPLYLRNRLSDLDDLKTKMFSKRRSVRCTHLHKPVTTWKKWPEPPTYYHVTGMNEVFQVVTPPCSAWLPWLAAMSVVLPVSATELSVKMRPSLVNFTYFNPGEPINRKDGELCAVRWLAHRNSANSNTWRINFANTVLVNFIEVAPTVTELQERDQLWTMKFGVNFRPQQPTDVTT